MYRSAAMNEKPDESDVAMVEVDAIIQWWRQQHEPHNRSSCPCFRNGACGSTESLARAVQVSHSTIHRRRRHLLMSVFEADRWARTLGVAPNAIWHDWGRAALTPSESSPCVEVRGVMVGGDIGSLLALLAPTPLLGVGIENIGWSTTGGGRQVEPATHCGHGHELSGANLLVTGGRRQCRVCNRRRTAESRARRRTRQLVDA